MNQGSGKGLLVALSCYVIWGTLPIFWKLLSAVPSSLVQVHRMIWCFVCVAVFCIVTKRHFLLMFRQRCAVLTLLAAGVLCTVNWTTYVITVNSGNIVESALGYYINPLISILIGLVFFKEKLSPAQVAATVLAVIGVVTFTVSYGQVPVMGLILAFSFGAYGAVKKWGGYPSVEAMAVESTFTGAAGLVALIAGCFMPGVWEALTPVTAVSPMAWTEGGAVLMALFVLAGFFTWLPLQLFSEAANRIPLTWIGFCQYLSPTLALCIGVFMFGEPFTFAHGVLFGCLWIGIALIAIEAAMRSRAKG
ncbi:MAG: EamA family transporter RarD [Eggerthellaceae bacterium]|nr:EamA family transporter RarD [Eggerthellaceae bacterium]